jgi:Arc/MetJ-type ribon-helix-helix transcriptional regulator
MSEVHTVTVKADIPDRLHGEMEALVREGWFQDLNDLMLEAVRRLLDVHRPELMERFVREDIEWGLRGDE